MLVWDSLLVAVSVHIRLNVEYRIIMVLCSSLFIILFELYTDRWITVSTHLELYWAAVIILY